MNCCLEEVHAMEQVLATHAQQRCHEALRLVLEDTGLFTVDAAGACPELPLQVVVPVAVGTENGPTRCEVLFAMDVAAARWLTLVLLRLDDPGQADERLWLQACAGLACSLMARLRDAALEPDSMTCGAARHLEHPTLVPWKRLVCEEGAFAAGIRFIP